ncbi:MAG: ASKHA domain-containing protein, partial [Planctomycetota bacterium]
HKNATLLEAVAHSGIILNSSCGAKGTCGKCLVLIEPDKQEVLACQYRIHSDLTITVPPESRFYEQQILEHGIDTQIKVSPTVCKIFLKINSPDPGVLKAALSKSLPDHPIRIAKNIDVQLSQLAIEQLAEGITVVCHLDPNHDQAENAAYTACTLEPGDTADKLYGLAVDIGTTTVVAGLIDMTDGKLIATEAAVNPQSRFGDDVVSRIAYADSNEKLNELHIIIIDCLNGLTSELCKKAQISSQDIYEMCVVGNTTMNHLFLKHPVKQLGQAPYHAHSLQAHDRRGDELGLHINPAANIHTVENIAGYVGADTTAVALATNIDSADEVTLAIDIGTNGELLLGDGDKLYAASCAAGPAFEGARISCGSRAVEGAIEAVIINGEDIDVDVIGSSSPRSICGSGLIDAVAVMLDLGIIDATGRFVESDKLKDNLPADIHSRLLENDDGPAFLLAEGISLTQRDIRQVQLGKAAIQTGIKLLQNKLKLEDNDIKHILLAGAFGNYISPENAMRIGLLPKVPIERIRFVGNAAGTGASMVLLSRDCRRDCRILAKKIKYKEIAHDQNFPNTYADSMLF